MICAQPFVILLALAAAVSAATDSFNISGVVVDANTHAVLPNISVKIMPAADPGAFVEDDSSSLLVKTDAAGKFFFHHLSRGKYVLSAREGNESPQLYRQHGGFSTAIVTGPGLDSEHVAFPLQRANCRLSGTVTDSDGEPVSQAFVALLAPNPLASSGAAITIAGQTTTSASGRFRFGHLHPGRYHLAVTARPWYTSANIQTFAPAVGENGTAAAVQPALDQAYPVTYYGGGADPASSQAFVLSEGSSLTTDIVVREVPALHIALPANTSVSRIESIGPGGARLPAFPLMDQSSSMAIAPGTYAIALDSNSDNRHALLKGIVTLVASGPLSLPAQAASVIKGRVIFDQPGSAGPRLLALIGEDNEPLNSTEAGADGAFTFPQPVAPGRYRIATPFGGVATVKPDGPNSVSSDTFTVPDSAPAMLDLAVRTGTRSRLNVSGTVVFEGRPVEAASVVLFSSGQPGASVVGRDQSDSDGSFTIPDVAQGSYLLLAFDPDDKRVNLSDGATLKHCFAHAEKIKVPFAPNTAFKAPAQIWPCRP